MNTSFKIVKLIIVVLLVSNISSCSQSPKYETQTLPSGRIIKISGMGKMHFKNSDPALMLQYYTDLDINDKEALSLEVNEIWDVFRFNVEESGLNYAIIMASEMPTGIISKNKVHNFVYEKELSGEWVRARK